MLNTRRMTTCSVDVRLILEVWKLLAREFSWRSQREPKT